MASKLGISDQKGSDAVFDVRCTICADDAINRKGIFNCQKCSKHFCNDCVIMHNKILKDHYVTDIVEGPSIEGQNVEDQNNSKAAKGIHSFEMCVEHGNDCKLEMFCEDDQKMLCNVCLRNEHRNCLSVVRDKII
ncbi:hypothetical protein DPMN_145091 [Dreissena polymorpha]|uniref:B box-type domain-containing protein n=1 Tax=Dreissena polymorpha TaxID=45954 RepID=A0A9D4F4B1_DREPO|nr:hypothetical protein DPMN_145091 [Dreissena polymorpha]